jgi:hypothetical protein
VKANQRKIWGGDQRAGEKRILQSEEFEADERK